MECSDIISQSPSFRVPSSGFSLDRLDTEGTSAGGQSVNGGGLMRGDIDLMGET